MFDIFSLVDTIIFIGNHSPKRAGCLDFVIIVTFDSSCCTFVDVNALKVINVPSLKKNKIKKYSMIKKKNLNSKFISCNRTLVVEFRDTNDQENYFLFQQPKIVKLHNILFHFQDTTRLY